MGGANVNRQSYEFHNVELSSTTNVNLHALAVDEHRQPFSPAVWRKPKFKSFATATEQVWFAGSHADIGGGYIEEGRRADAKIKALDDITLDWMLKRVINYFPDFPADSGAWKMVDPSWSYAPQHASRKGFYKLMPLALRSIANHSLAAIGWREANVGYDRHAESIGEMIHVSVLERLGYAVDGERAYAPYSLTAMLDVMQSSYERSRTITPLKIVNWDGKTLDPTLSEDASSALKLIADARQNILEKCQ